MNSRLVLLLFIIGLIVLFVALFIPVSKSNSTKESIQEVQVEDSQGVSVSDLFKVEDRKDQEQIQPIPTDIPKDEACNLDGQMVRGGTVTSNTICVNESPAVITPKI
jgi:hypothetical protein